MDQGTEWPSARMDHAMAAVGERIFLFGGSSDSISGEVRELHPPEKIVV